MSGSTYDLAVIGAGIQGAGVAEAAALCGLSVVVLEQDRVAGGTSSRSSKLIHGGLRYLESGQFGLVRECLRERAVLLRRAPSLVRLLPFHIPVYRDAARPAWMIALGLGAYSLLALGGAGAGFSRIPRRDWGELDGLDVEQLVSVFCYQDAATDDAALTRAVMASAMRLGARLEMPARVEAGDWDGECWRLSLSGPGTAGSVSARTLVNAAGPWVSGVVEILQPAAPLPQTELVQGAHIVVQHRMEKGAWYVEAADRRAVFLVPRGEQHTLIGTTETVYTGDPAGVVPLQGEVDYLLQTARHFFPVLAGCVVADSFAGLRVLSVDTGVAFHRSRETLLVTDPASNGALISIVGGKLTAFAATARRLLGLRYPGLLTTARARALASLELNDPGSST